MRVEGCPVSARRDVVDASAGPSWRRASCRTTSSSRGRPHVAEGHRAEAPRALPRHVSTRQCTLRMQTRSTRGRRTVRRAIDVVLVRVADLGVRMSVAMAAIAGASGIAAKLRGSRAGDPHEPAYASASRLQDGQVPPAAASVAPLAAAVASGIGIRWARPAPERSARSRRRTPSIHHPLAQRTVPLLPAPWAPSSRKSDREHLQSGATALRAERQPPSPPSTTAWRTSSSTRSTAGQAVEDRHHVHRTTDVARVIVEASTTPIMRSARQAAQRMACARSPSARPRTRTVVTGLEVRDAMTPRRLRIGRAVGSMPDQRRRDHRHLDPFPRTVSKSRQIRRALGSTCPPGRTVRSTSEAQDLTARARERARGGQML
jgi:hypothetical protein